MNHAGLRPPFDDHDGGYDDYDGDYEDISGVDDAHGDDGDDSDNKNDDFFNKVTCISAFKVIHINSN